MGAKTALKDVGRSMGIPFNIMNAITKCIPDNIEDPDTGEKSLEVSIEDALNDINIDGELKKNALELREYQNKFPNLFRIAQKIEGLPRQTSIHAAGIVIAPVPISEFMPLMHCKSDDGILASQYDMKTLELIGAVKYDFLSLSTLTVINATLQSIKKHTGQDIDIANIPLDDRGVYKLLSSGETLGVFQVESFMFKELLKKIKPSTFSDIVAAVALGRPGPLDAGMDEVYIRNKHGFSRPDYPHEDLIPVLEKTHGIILYQEQLMEICKVLAGFDASEQDKVRKATGKKNLELIEEMGELFIKRAVARGYDQEMLESVWEKMKTFGRYGFNLAHSACYAMLTYRTAWLKVHYPIHFMAATMSFLTNSNAKDASDKLKDAISETRKMGFKLALPDINKSSYEFTVIDDKTINVGLRAIKGVGMKAIESIYETRPYFSFDDMLSKINRTICNKGVMDSLIMSGALDSFDENRIKLLEMYYGSRNENVPEFIKLDKDNIFAIADRYTMHDKLEWEKAHIGVYISRHPMEDIVSESWKDASLGSNIDAVGVLIKCNKIVTKKGDDMAFGTLDTSEGPLELVIFPNTFANVKDKLKINTIVRVKGKKEEESKCIINSLTNPRIPNLKDITI